MSKQSPRRKFQKAPGSPSGSHSNKPSMPPEILQSQIELFESLKSMRCIERNLIYVVGIPADATTLNLKSKQFFGRFGKIDKFQCGSVAHKGNNSDVNTVGAHITFRNEHDALMCLFCCSGSTFNESPLKASVGINKYCNRFLNFKKCNNPFCTFKHSIGEEIDRFTEEEMSVDPERFLRHTRPPPPPGIEFEMCDLFLDSIPKQPDFPNPIHLPHGLVFPDTKDKSAAKNETEAETESEKEVDSQSETDSEPMTREELENQQFFSSSSSVALSFSSYQTSTDVSDSSLADEIAEEEEDDYDQSRASISFFPEEKETAELIPITPEILIPDDDIRIPVWGLYSSAGRRYEEPNESVIPKGLIPDEDILDFWRRVRAAEPEMNYERDQEAKTRALLSQPQPSAIWPPVWHPKRFPSKFHL